MWRRFVRGNRRLERSLGDPATGMPVRRIRRGIVRANHDQAMQLASTRKTVSPPVTYGLVSLGGTCETLVSSQTTGAISMLMRIATRLN